MLSVLGAASDGDPGSWLGAALVVLTAGCVQGFTGMGFAVVSTPLLVVVLGSPHAVVMFSLAIGSVLGAAVLVETRRALRVRRTVPLVAGAVLGAPLGVAVLSQVSARAMTVAIAVTALVTAAAWMVRLPGPVPRERTVVSIAGLLGGFLNGSTSMGGPPPALVASMQRWEVAESRAALAVFNVTSYAVALAMGLNASDVEFLLRGWWLVPIAAVGTVAGMWSVRRVHGGVFRYALLATVWAAGLFALAAVLRT